MKGVILHMNKNPLDLNGLTMDDIDFSGVREALEKDKQMEAEYQRKYGDDWWEHYIADTNPSHGIDLDERSVNEAIFEGHRLFVMGNPLMVAEIETLYWKKMKRLFGPFYKRYVNHKTNDPRVNKALIKDALKSGKWRELPKELQGKYHRLAGE